MCNRIFFHQYRELKVLYQHQDTIVYLTQHVKLLNLCVIKQINKGSAYFYQGLMEAKLLKGLHHAGIPLYYEQYETESSLFLVEEYKAGESLYSICQSEQLSYSSILSYGIQLCDILQFLHSQPQPVLHLDLNPNNILIDQGRLSLLDFSAAICLEKEKYYGQRYGTLGYAAPEQYNQKAIEERTDIYSLGKVLQAMLDTVKMQEVSCKQFIGIEKIINRCTRHHKSRRYQSIQQVGSLLSKLYQKECVVPRKELDFVVAGTQSRIGTTHLAMLFSAYLKHVHGSCLYIERNGTGNAAKLVQECKKLGNMGFYEYEQVPIMPFGDKEVDQTLHGDFICTVTDYGVLNTNNVQEFMKYKNRFLVYGGKVHEKSYTWNCLKLLPTLADTYYFGNFMSQQEFKASEVLDMSKRVYRLPFEPCLKLSKKSEIVSVFSKIVKESNGCVISQLQRSEG